MRLSSEMKPAQTFQQIRESLGINKTEAGKKLGVNRRTVLRWEKNGPTVCAMLAIKYLLILNEVKK